MIFFIRKHNDNIKAYKESLMRGNNQSAYDSLCSTPIFVKKEYNTNKVKEQIQDFVYIKLKKFFF